MGNDNIQSNFNKDEIEKLFLINKKNKKVSRFIGLISIVAVLIGLSATVFSVFQLSESQTDAVNTLNNNKLIIDSLTIKSDSILQQKIMEDSVISIVLKYLKSTNKIGYANDVFTDTIQKYYLKSNLTLGEVKWHQDWHKRNFPRAKLVFDNIDILVSFNKKDTVEVYMDAIYYPDSLKRPINTLYQIKLNNENKIFYIRNLEPKE